MLEPEQVQRRAPGAFRRYWGDWRWTLGRALLTALLGWGVFTALAPVATVWALNRATFAFSLVDDLGNAVLAVGGLVTLLALLLIWGLPWQGVLGLLVLTGLGLVMCAVLALSAH